VTQTIGSRPTPWRTILLTCGKCARKMDGGYGPKGKEALRTTLRTVLKDAGHGRTVRIIETRCMGPCPKRATTVLNTSRPDAFVTVPKGTPMDGVLRLLL
jgi:predicted metal-binding protein